MVAQTEPDTVLIPVWYRGTVVAHTSIDRADERFITRRIVMLNGYAGIWVPDLYVVQPIHRVLFGMRPENPLVIDHINHDKLDNRRKNLRACTHSENCFNRRGPQSGASTGVRNVSRNKCGAFVVSFKRHNRPNYVGSFSTLKQAEREAKAARLAAGGIA